MINLIFKHSLKGVKKLLIKCPLLKGKEIEDYECFENSEIAEKMIKETSLPQKFKIENWREICLNCPNHRED